MGLLCGRLVLKGEKVVLDVRVENVYGAEVNVLSMKSATLCLIPGAP